MELLAPAKINLTLEITGKRADGYHELKTFMQKVDLADVLTLERRKSGIALECQTPAGAPELGAGPENIAYRAAESFFAASGISAGVDMTLAKRIPIAAGLGGGSSDAAAVLLGLNDLYDAPLNRGTLLDSALRLGADVPFFVADYPAAFATGIGERLEKAAQLADSWILLVNPKVAVSTKWVYDNFALTSEGNPYTLGADFARFSGDSVLWPVVSELAGRGAAAFVNDLERVTMGGYPVVAEIKETLEKSGAELVMMSGSGPTVFAIYGELARAQEAREALAGRAFDIFLCRPSMNSCSKNL